MFPLPPLLCRKVFHLECFVVAVHWSPGSVGCVLTGPANQPTNFSKDANDTVFKVLRERQPARHEFAPLFLKACNTNHSKVGSKRCGEAPQLPPPLKMSRKTVHFFVTLSLPTPDSRLPTPSLAHSLLLSCPPFFLPILHGQVACHTDLQSIKAQSANTPPLNERTLCDLLCCLVTTCVCVGK